MAVAHGRTIELLGIWGPILSFTLILLNLFFSSVNLGRNTHISLIALLTLHGGGDGPSPGLGPDVS